jgi:hypothetical protein
MAGSDNDFQKLVYALSSFFLLVFGSYGLYAEYLWKKFRAAGKHENLCVEANYYIQKKGFFSRMFLFPFTKIKSSNSFFVSLLGAIAWVIIISIIVKTFFTS